MAKIDPFEKHLDQCKNWFVQNQYYHQSGRENNPS